MPVVYTGAIKLRGAQIAEIGFNFTQTNHSRWSCSIEYRFKTRSSKTETSNDVTEQAHTGQALTADGNFTLFDYQVNHVKTEFKVDVRRYFERYFNG
jgi:hypothetical protein